MIAPNPPTPPKPPAAKWWAWEHLKRLAIGAVKSGATGAFLGAFCAFLPDHFVVAKIICRFAAHFLGGG